MIDTITSDFILWHALSWSWSPSDLQVFIDAKPAANVYVVTYGGWLTSMSDKNHAYSLSEALDAVNAKYKKGFHYAVGYNR